MAILHRRRPLLPRLCGRDELRPRALPLGAPVSRMSPKLRRNSGVQCGTPSKSILIPTCCTLWRNDELACVAALLARSPLENSSPVHPANFYRTFRWLARRLRLSPECLHCEARALDTVDVALKRFAPEIPCTRTKTGVKCPGYSALRRRWSRRSSTRWSRPRQRCKRSSCCRRC
jgi:hypothetical protein